MKIFILITLNVGVFFQYSWAQEFTISLQRCNKIYKGVENSMDIFVEGKTCKVIIAKTNNGILMKLNCHYIYRPDSIGDVKFEIYLGEKNKFKKIGASWFEVKQIPLPIAYVGGLNGSKIKKGFLNAQQGVGAYADPCLGFDLTYMVESFMFIIIRDNKIIFSQKNSGNVFSQEIKENLRTLINNDAVLFTNIKCKGPDNIELSPKSLEFSIVE
jgi:hypothetical protein